MTITAAEILLTIGEDGTLKLPQEALNALRTRQVWLTVQDGLMTVKPRPKTLNEIEDPEERARVRAQVLEELAIADVPPLPDDYDLRADIYD